MATDEKNKRKSNPQLENRNPYSKKNPDYVNLAKEQRNTNVNPYSAKKPDFQDLCEISEIKIEAQKQYTESELFDLLKEIFALIGIEIAEIPGESEKPERILEKLLAMEYISHHSQNAQCGEIVCALSRVAMRQDLPYVPSGIFESHQTSQESCVSSVSISEMSGIEVAEYIAKKITDWRIFLIEKSSGGDFYAGVVSLENAEIFKTKLNRYFLSCAMTDYNCRVNLMSMN